MRKLFNKKGFSLVELMIVVVIMGILIAVASPLYGAITDNAEKNTCENNQQSMRSVFAKYCVENATNNARTLLPNGTYSSKDGGTGDIDQSFINSFDEGKLPVCSVEGNYYVITRVADYEVTIECYNADGTVCTEHNE